MSVEPSQGTLAFQAVDKLLAPEGLHGWLEHHQNESVRRRAALLSEELGLHIPYSTLRRWQEEINGGD